MRSLPPPPVLEDAGGDSRARAGREVDQNAEEKDALGLARSVAAATAHPPALPHL